MFSCEYWESSKTTSFEEQLRTATSEETLGSDCLGLSLERVTLKTTLTYLVILQKYQSLSNQSPL